jgi:nicotinamide-nucleotide amidase
VEDEICRRLGELVVGQDERMMAHVVGDLLRQRHATLATAESCTGGLVGEMLTAVAGSSDYYLGGVVSYSNKLKTDLLGVDQALIARHGAVSEPVAAAMAQGACRRLGSDWAVSITGIAGPGGGTAEKPVGLIYAGLCGPGVASVQRHIFPGDRATIRMRAALTALNALRLALLRK